MSEQQDLASAAIALAAAAGFDTTALEAQAKEREGQRAESANVDSLRSRIAELEAKLGEQASSEQPTPQSEELQFAERLRDRMNESVTPWHSLGGDDAA